MLSISAHVVSAHAQEASRKNRTRGKERVPGRWGWKDKLGNRRKKKKEAASKMFLLSVTQFFSFLTYLMSCLHRHLLHPWLPLQDFACISSSWWGSHRIRVNTEESDTEGKERQRRNIRRWEGHQTFFFCKNISFPLVSHVSWDESRCFLFLSFSLSLSQLLLPFSCLLCVYFSFPSLFFSLLKFLTFPEVITVICLKRSPRYVSSWDLFFVHHHQKHLIHKHRCQRKV